jgi:hypothetical protein
MTEIWKDVADPFWANYYQVSNTGKIRSKDREIIKEKYSYVKKGRIIAQRRTKKEPHLFVDFSVTIDGVKIQKTRYVHKEVALAFIPKTTEKIIRYKPISGTSYTRKSVLRYRMVAHKDGNYNNNNVDNLFWINQLDLYNRQITIGNRIPRNDLFTYSSRWRKKYQDNETIN